MRLNSRSASNRSDRTGRKQAPISKCAPKFKVRLITSDYSISIDFIWQTGNFFFKCAEFLEDIR